MDLYHSGMGPDEEIMKNKDKLCAYIDLTAKAGSTVPNKVAVMVESISE